jgi:triphosphatase
MGIETELNFEVAPQDLWKVKTALALHRQPLKEETLVSVYFDTPKHKLAASGVSLRVRYNGGKRLQTIKSEGPNGSFRRGEWEREIKGMLPTFAKLLARR